ncbi:hypothetical protein GJ744_008310 [Endocarpon pusillum]|uniref:Uncharacterized protein n=1 Tax=Endocarpon pusillum TaxID=364733 RepID=A0A8H7E5M2_9EURO|nr:hypothetical protein GJ744_008310 [Endocarpon pusillum]
MPPAQFKTQLESSSYLHPTANSAYAPLREKIVETAALMGYDFDTLPEIALDWSSDQDPNNHVTNPAYARFASTGNIRLCESFARKKISKDLSLQSLYLLLDDRLTCK